MQVNDPEVLKQGSQAWLDFRKDKIGGSDCAVALDISPYKSAVNLWMEKKGIKEPQKMNDKMALGHHFEDDARRDYEFETGNFMQPSVYVHDEHPNIMASVDGIDFSGDLILEIKCGRSAYQKAKDKIICITYLYQMQHNMMVTGAKNCHYYAYDIDQMEPGCLIEIKRDDTLIEAILDQELSFLAYLDKDYFPGYEIMDIDDEMRDFLARRRAYKKNAKLFQDLLAQADKRLLSYANEDNMIIGDLHIKKVKRKGAINYKELLQAHANDIDVEQYRDKDIEYFKIMDI